MKGKTARRIAATVVALASTALVLSACTGTGSDSKAGSRLELLDEPATINVTWWGSDARAELTTKAIDLFEKKYPNITVEGQFKDWNGYWDALATSTAAGDSADVLAMDELYLASYADRGALLDLGTASNLINTSKFSKESLATGQVGDVQYAVPTGVAAYALIANVDLFKKYGVDLPDDTTWTWNDLADVAKELTDASGGAIQGVGNIGGFDAGSVKYWARSLGGEVFDADGNVTLDPKALVKMWKFIMSVQASGAGTAPSTLVEQFGAGLAGSGVALNTAAMQTFYNTQITAVQAASGQNLVLLQLPKTGKTKPDSLKPSMYWAASSQSKHPAEAAAFINFMLNDPGAAKILGTDRGITANTTLREQLKTIFTPLDKVAIEYQDGLTPGTTPVVTPNGASGFEAILQRYTQEVLFGQTTPEAAAKAFIKELQGEIDAAK